VLTCVTGAHTPANRRLVKYHKVEWWLKHMLRCLFKAAVMCFILFSSDSVSFYCKKTISRKVPSSPFTSPFSSPFRVLVMSLFQTSNFLFTKFTCCSWYCKLIDAVTFQGWPPFHSGSVPHSGRAVSIYAAVLFFFPLAFFFLKSNYDFFSFEYRAFFIQYFLHEGILCPKFNSYTCQLTYEKIISVWNSVKWLWI